MTASLVVEGWKMTPSGKRSGLRPALRDQTAWRQAVCPCRRPAQRDERAGLEVGEKLRQFDAAALEVCGARRELQRDALAGGVDDLVVSALEVFDVWPAACVHVRGSLQVARRY
jgi:hypothetical protein